MCMDAYRSIALAHYCRRFAARATLTLSLIICSPVAPAVEPHATRPVIQIMAHPFDQQTFSSMLPRLSDKLGIELRFKTVDLPYTDNVEYELIYNPNIDIVDLLTPSVSRFEQAGWITDLSQFPEIVAASKRQHPFLHNTKHRDGKLLGLARNTNIVGLPLIDLSAYRALGLTRRDFPTTWTELYQQVDTLAQKGHRDFFYPQWFPLWSGLPLSFLLEVWNRGGEITDPISAEPIMFESSGAAYQTLQDWRRAWESGAVPKQVIGHNLREYLNDFMETPYAISVQSSFTLLQTETMAPSKKPELTLVPRIEQDWGTPISSIQIAVQRPRLSESPEMQQLIKIFLEINQGTGEDEFSFAQKSLQKQGLLPAYNEFLNSDIARDIIREKLPLAADEKVLMDIYEHSTAHLSFWDLIWHEELTDHLQLALEHYLLTPSQSPEAVIKGINREILKIKRKYGY